MIYKRYHHSNTNMERASHYALESTPSSENSSYVDTEDIKSDKKQMSENLLPNIKSQKKRNKKTTASSKSNIAISPGSTLYSKKDPEKLPGILDLNRLDFLATQARQYILPLGLFMSSNEKKKKLPLLAAIKPENEKAEKDRFMMANFNYNPYFVYRGCADDEAMNKFKEPSNKYISQAILIMQMAIAHFGSYETFEEVTGGHILTKPQIYSLVKKYLSTEELDDEVQINLSEDLLSRGSMTRAKGKAVLNVRCINLREHVAEGLLRHEIGTHYLRSCNTRHQPWRSVNVRRNLGMGPVNPTEEGLASLHSVLFRDKPFLWRAALLYYTAYMASKMSFKDLFHDLGKFVQNPNVRWDYCLRAKRGQVDTARPGCFCKDQFYLEGALQLLKRRRVLDFHMLVRLGKVSFEDVDRPHVTKIARLNNTRIPWFMNDVNVYQRQLDHIAKINGLTDSILSKVD